MAYFLIVRTTFIFLCFLFSLVSLSLGQKENPTSLKLSLAPLFSEFSYLDGSEWVIGYELSAESHLLSNLYLQMGYSDFGETRLLYIEEEIAFLFDKPTGEADFFARGPKLGLIWKQSLGLIIN